MKQKSNSRLIFIVSVFIFGTLGPFVRNIPVSSGELALYRAILATLLLGVYLLVTKQNINIRKIKKELPFLLLSGFALGFNWILLFQAYRYTTVSVATLTYYFAPVIVTVLCPVLFKEKMGLKQWICFIMSTIGIVLITGIGDISSGSNHFIGILYGLGAACFYAVIVLSNKAIKGVDGIHRTFIQFVVSIIVLIPYVAFRSGVNLDVMDKKGWICLLIVGLIHTGFNYCLYFSSLKDLPGQQVSVLSYIDPLVAVIVSVFVLGEEITLIQIIGGFLILGFTLWNEISPKESEIEK